ncbi:MULTISPECIES: hypothetical protein [unclassified Bradyrhizobium]|uniref:hypothetical protein n=1 Tax=unclassified Bradyrhizobium TaxID=2631580 RepID=UPI0028E7BDDC|nr:MULTISPECIES: hypothetical protein [unclassified Bradyrhizobium]
MTICTGTGMIGLEEAVQVQLAIVLMLASVLALVGLAFWLLRDYAAERRLQARMGQPWRVAPIQVVRLASGRRLVLIRHRDMEHLLLIGGPADLVVESRAMQAGEYDVANGDGN